MVVAIELMKKWPDSGYILKAETTEFADRLGMICKRKGTIKDKSKNFGVLDILLESLSMRTMQYFSKCTNIYYTYAYFFKY